MNSIPVRLGLIQRVLPEYRVPFFEMLADACPQGLGLFCGDPRPAEAIQTASKLEKAHLTHSINRHLFSGKFFLCWQSGLRRWLESWNPQVLILEANPRYLHIPTALHWMHQRSRPVIGWGLGSPLRDNRGLKQSFMKKFFGQFDAMITYSQTGFEQYRKLGIDPARIFIAPNAVSARPARTPPDKPTIFMDGKARLLFVGRLQARKRIDVLLQACARLPEQLQPRLWIIGDGPERPSLERAAQSLYPQAEFIGAKFGTDLEPYFAQSDLFVLPGTGGLAIQQAMAFGLPVIVGEADGTQADLVRAQNGVQIPPGNPDALCAVLQELLVDPDKMRRMGAESFRIVEQEINLEAMVQSFSQAVNFTLEK